MSNNELHTHTKKSDPNATASIAIHTDDAQKTSDLSAAKNTSKQQRMHVSRTSSNKDVHKPKRKHVRRTQYKNVSKGFSVQRLTRIACIMLGCVLAAIVGCIILINIPLFSIDTIEAVPTEHVSAETIEKLTEPIKGKTLFNFKKEDLEKYLKKDPWVASVSYKRKFPHTLVVEVHEKEVAAVVQMPDDAVAWYAAKDKTWIQPVAVETKDAQKVQDKLLSLAQASHAQLITHLPEGVSPSPAAPITDEELLAVYSYQTGFSSDFSAQIISYSAPGTASITCTLSNGVEVSLGEPYSIADKEQAIKALLQSYENKLTYINVRTPQNPTYRILTKNKAA